jgi:hypothetical protein
MAHDIALPYLSAVEPSDISIIRRLGTGDAGDVFQARGASYANGKAEALKVVGIYLHLSTYLHVYSRSLLS